MVRLCDAADTAGRETSRVPLLDSLVIPAPRAAEPLAPAVATAVNAVQPERLVSLLQQLIAVPSITGSAAESDAQHQVARRLDAMGLETDAWQIDLPSVTADPEFPGLEAPRDEAWGVVGSWRGEDPDAATVVLNGHIDVVPPGDVTAWSTSPWSGEVRDGQVYGRGACDMKGGLACQLLAVDVLRAAGVRLRGSLLVQSVVGEEDGGLGTFATVRRGYRGDLAIVSEPTSTNIVTANAGALTFRLTVPGRAVHASVRTEGVDAIDKYLLVHTALRALEARRNRDANPLMEHLSLPYPLSVGTVRAGDWASSVPDLLVAEGRLGVALGEPVEAARAELEQVVAEVCAADPWLASNAVRVEWYGGQFASSMVGSDHPLVSLVGAAHRRVTGRNPAVYGAPWGSDIRLLSDLAGVPAVHYGPGDVRKAHGPDESVPVTELVTVTRSLVMLIARACGAS
ncbi:MAG: acetylornithine deacetylase [Actinomycetota bacterium]|jgi:acetylornithine deacetylase|nr:acetylornithine deacetylase [Actinomycetota bacterium]